MYYSDIYVGAGANRKRLVKALHSDKKIAEGMLADLIKRRDAKDGLPTPDMTVAAFIADYLEFSRATKSRQSYYIDKRSLRDMLLVVPAERLAQLTPRYLLQVHTAWKQTLGLYERTRRLQAIKTAMRWAEGYYQGQPKQDWRLVKPEKTPKGRLLFYTEAELKTLRAESQGIVRTMVYLCYYAGLRRAEAAWLHWSDVDFERGTLRVQHKEGFSPKDNEARSIPMCADLAAYLKGLERKSDFVAVDEEGHNWMPDSLSHAFARVVKSSGIKKGSLHTLRHSFASQLMTRGAKIYTVSKLMGHATVKMTEVYAHLGAEAQTSAIELLNA